MMRTELTAAMKDYFGPRPDLVEHTLQVTAFAEQLLGRIKAKDEGVNADVVVAAALMHDIGIPEAERQHGSAAGHYQEQEGPPIARRLMESLQLDPDLITEVCEIVAHHHSPGVVQTPNFAILYDADWLVNLPNQYERMGMNRVPEAAIAKRYLTDAGRSLAKELFLKP